MKLLFKNDREIKNDPNNTNKFRMFKPRENSIFNLKKSFSVGQATTYLKCQYLFVLHHSIPFLQVFLFSIKLFFK